MTFYAASGLAGRGEALRVWAPPALTAAERAVIGAPLDFYAFHYPPSALLLMMPLAHVSYLWAFAGWTLAGLLAFVAMQRRALPDPAGLGLALGFPGVFQNVFQGQNGLFTTSLLGFALLFLEERPLLAGALLGLLTAKPQLAGAALLALLAGRRWRALGAAMVTAAALAGLSALVLGTQCWSAFLGNMDFAVRVLETPGVLPWARMPTVEVAALLGGAPLGIARALQALAAVGAAFALVFAWARPLSEPARVAVLAGAIFLLTPFAFDYDTALLALPALWLGRDWLRPEGGRRGEGVLVVALWLAPIALPAVAYLTHVQLGPVLAILLFAAAFRRG